MRPQPAPHHRTTIESPSDKQIVIPIRVRYVECDPMNVAHHAAYLPWLELARTELLRQRGTTYRDMEARGQYMVVARLNMRYRKPARYDDELQIDCRQLASRGAKLEHCYEVRRGDDVLATGETTLVCVDGAGCLQPIPPRLL